MPTWSMRVPRRDLHRREEVADADAREVLDLNTGIRDDDDARSRIEYLEGAARYRVMGRRGSKQSGTVSRRREPGEWRR